MGAGNVRSILLAGALVASVLMLPGVSQAQLSGSVTWNGWTFTYEVSGNFDGLSLKGVQFQGLPLINKISFPVVRVFYDNNACGPYADRVGGTLAPIPWAGNATIAKREFTLNGRQWYEIGIRPQVGNYDMYQVYYLSPDGILDAHLYSKGLACVVNHVHYPNWRIDFDIIDYGNDQIQRNTGTGYETKLIEFNANATEAINHGWRVRDSVTGNYVDVLPGFTDFTIPNETTQPESSYANNTVFGRLYRASEDTGWTYGPNTQVPYNNGESIGNADIVFWYEGYLPHLAAEGTSLWHSTGLRLAVNGGPPDTTPPAAPSGLSATAAGTQITLSWTASTDNLGVTGYLVERCQGAGCSSFTQIATPAGTSYPDSGLQASTSYSYRVRATDAAGNLSSYSTTATATTGTPDITPPTDPTGLTATAAGSSQINLAWAASTDTVGVTGYRVERCQGVGCTTFTQVATPAGNSYPDTGLQAATSYSYQVRATDAAGNPSGYSNTATATTPAPPPGLVAAYGFEEGTGATVGDASGSGNTGTINGATRTTAGKYGNALVFNGTSARVTIPDAASLHLTTGMTLEAWVKPATVTPVWRDVIMKGNDNYYLEGTSSNGSVPAGGGTFTSSPLYGPAALAVNTWAHLALTYDGATLRLYVNGGQVASRAQTGAIATSTNPLEIGGDSLFGQYFNGTIDEVRVYNRALAPAEVQADMNTPLVVGPPATTPPTISNIADQVTAEDTPTGAIAFTVGDAETAVGSLTVSGSSSNLTLVPNGNIVFGGSGANRTVTVSPAANQIGTATITVTVSDGSLTASDPFVLTVNAQPATVTAFASGTAIETGTLQSGSPPSLNADDNSYYVVNSTTSGTRTTSWYGSFAGVTNNLTNLKVTYKGKNSNKCTQTVAIWRWTDSTWVQLDSRSVSTTEIEIANLAPTGTLSDYVSGTTGDGELRVRVRCTRSGQNFSSSGDLMKIVYDVTP